MNSLCQLIPSKRKALQLAAAFDLLGAGAAKAADYPTTILGVAQIVSLLKAGAGHWANRPVCQ